MLRTLVVVPELLRRSVGSHFKELEYFLVIYNLVWGTRMPGKLDARETLCAGQPGKIVYNKQFS